MKYDGECGVDSPESGYGPVAGFCGRCNKPSGFIEGGEFLDKLNDY
jgi:hypothetical protein